MLAAVILLVVSGNAIREHGVSGFATDVAAPAAEWTLERSGAGDVVSVEARSSAPAVWLASFVAGWVLLAVGVVVLLAGAVWGLSRRSLRRATLVRRSVPSAGAGETAPKPLGVTSTNIDPSTTPTEVPSVAGGTPPAASRARRVAVAVEGRARDAAPHAQDLARRGREGFVGEVAPRIADQAARGRESAAKALSRFRRPT